MTEPPASPLPAPPAGSPAPEPPLLEVRGLRTWFPIRRGVMARTVGHVKAVDDVSLVVRRGQTVGLVGESGCGKTTLGRTLLRLERATAGQVLFEGRDLLGLPPAEMQTARRHLQMIFQDPYSCLNPRLTVLDIVTEGLVEHGLLEGAPEAAAVRLLREVGVDADALYRYPHEFSGGQRQRISVARALSLQPRFIVCDEPVSALDVSVQAQVINLLMELRERYGLAYLFIAHDLSVVRHLSHRVVVMYLGRIIEEGPAAAVMDEPLHPYTRALVSAVPVPGREGRPRIVLEGEVPSAARPPAGCRFHPRCSRAMPVCRQEYPERRELGERAVWCHLYADSARNVAPGT